MIIITVYCYDKDRFFSGTRQQNGGDALVNCSEIQPQGNENFWVNGFWMFKDPATFESNELPVYEISNIQVFAPAVLDVKSGIYWIQENIEFIITGEMLDVSNSGVIKTDGTVSTLMLMSERYIDDVPSGDDVRIIVHISGNPDLTFTMTCKFKNSGNYKIDQDRLNRGLKRINKPYRLKMDPNLLEFDIHI